ncbi:MAG: leucyl/phenylalanyl-tRNA--protein transferase [Verrucomicrobia bacterium]|jgi:leucyl/phenylalanyl-tRNA---protein transferase|nr:leucyl/phenylalanyl-tRNA--protein transferase [Verrucomicrobiota bacterium]MBT7700669.1 leucyl/phenylalanyl-tRNA--protein transferase [Verrucomicrobiota bacterium]
MFLCHPAELRFPPVENADEDGLLAIGGDLRVERLLLAYRSGIFPWYSEGQPIIWWSPDPRFVLFPGQLRISKSMSRILRSDRFHSTWDTDFPAVIKQCRFAPRAGQSGTWITPRMEAAYCDLHRAGHAHSIEVWQNDELVGGLYGVIVGRCFCGESMFSRVSNASKYALIKLVERLKAIGIELIDSQVPNPHMMSLGAKHIPRSEYLTYLQ